LGFCVIEQLSKRAPISVAVDGVSVVLTLGNRSVTLDYDTANRLAVLLRGNGKIAKRNAGDLSVKLIGFSNLTDAVLEEHRLQKSRDATAVYSLRR
jgi:hypothetical protein